MILPWVKEMVEAELSLPLRVGMICMHPDGYKVKIINGQFWGTHGVSNFWYWKRILKNGKLSKKTYHGYGWSPK